MGDEIAVVLVTFIVLGIPALGLTARLAIKPVVEALIRLREAFTQSGAIADEDIHARIGALEQRIDAIQDTLQPLVEAEEFRRQLEAGRGTSAATGGGASDDADPTG